MSEVYPITEKVPMDQSIPQNEYHVAVFDLLLPEQQSDFSIYVM
jgi:hypothetical protein